MIDKVQTELYLDHVLGRRQTFVSFREYWTLLRLPRLQLELEMLGQLLQLDSKQHG